MVEVSRSESACMNLVQFRLANKSQLNNRGQERKVTVKGKKVISLRSKTGKGKLRGNEGARSIADYFPKGELKKHVKKDQTLGVLSTSRKRKLCLEIGNSLEFDNSEPQLNIQPHSDINIRCEGRVAAPIFETKAKPIHRTQVE